MKDLHRWLVIVLLLSFPVCGFCDEVEDLRKQLPSASNEERLSILQKIFNFSLITEK